MHTVEVEVDEEFERLLAEEEKIERITFWMDVVGKRTWKSRHRRVLTGAPLTWGLPARVSIC